jgi:hypothetical protein
MSASTEIRTHALPLQELDLPIGDTDAETTKLLNRGSDGTHRENYSVYILICAPSFEAFAGIMVCAIQS